METQNSSGQISGSIPANDSTVLVTHGTISQLSRDQLPAGSMLGGAYKIIALIGKGGMGDVYRARHIVLQKEFAVKVLTGQELNNVNWLRFQTEAKVIAKLDHKNVVKVYNLGLHNNELPFYAMDLLEGEPLDGVITRLGPLQLKDAIPIFLQVCDGLGYAHRHGVIHRDIKPANIMLIVESGDVPTVKLLDFGIAKLSSVESKAAQSLTAPGEIFGSPLYMSPEQCLGQNVDARSDIYSLGCTIFESLTGKPPFKGDNAFQTICLHQSEAPPTLSQVTGRDFSPAIEHLIARCLKKRPEDRYQSMKEMEVDLLRVAQGKDLHPTYINLRDEIAAEVEEDEDDHAVALQSDNKRTMIWMSVALASTLSLVISASMFLFTDKKATAVSMFKFSGSLGNARSSAAGAQNNAITKAGERNKKIREEALTKFDKQDQETIKALDNDKFPVFNKKQTLSDPSDFGGDMMEVVHDTGYGSHPFNHGDIMVDGMQATKFEFPAFLPFGLISWSKTTTPDGKKYGPYKTPCKGPVFVPRGAKLSLDIDQNVSHDPHVLTNFKDGDLDSLMFKKYEDDGDVVLRQLAAIKSLRSIDLTSNEVTDKSFGFINQQTRLKSLSVKETGISIENICHLKRLRQLELLNVRGLQNAFKVLPYLQDDLVITTLKIGNQPIGDQQIEYIKSLKNLEHLDINGTRLTDAQLQELTALKNIKHLSLADSNLSPKCLEIFKTGFPKLVELEFDTTNPAWTAAHEQRLKKAIKIVKIIAPNRDRACHEFLQ